MAVSNFGLVAASSWAQAHVRNGKGLTARTRNSEVLPAFCSPIMVMSISVALLSEARQQSKSVLAGAFCFFVDRNVIMGGSKRRMPNRLGEEQMEADGGGTRTRTGAEASHRCGGRCWPSPLSSWKKYGCEVMLSGSGQAQVQDAAVRMMSAGWETYSRTRNPCGAMLWRSQRDLRVGEVESQCTKSQRTS